MCVVQQLFFFSRLPFTCAQAIAKPGKAGRLGPALACLKILPSERGHYYYRLIRHYCAKGNCSALASIQSALVADDRFRSFKQNPSSAW